MIAAENYELGRPAGRPFFIGGHERKLVARELELASIEIRGKDLRARSKLI